jgi:hypothetical protein
MSSIFKQLHLLPNLDDVCASHEVYSARIKDSIARTRGLSGKPKKSKLDDALSHFGTVIHRGLAANTDEDQEIDDITFTTMEPELFSSFRKSVGVSDAAYIDSMSKLSGGNTEASGKSGSLFWFSEDHKYVLKSIAEGELDALTDMLPRYVDHFKNAAAQGRQCLLCKFFGAYLLQSEGKTIRLIAMNNMMGQGQPERAYDLKGTSEDRFVEQEDGDGKVMKDLNYSDSSVNFPASVAQQLQAAIEADSEFLRQENVMDYSLLLGVFPQTEVGTADAPVYKGVELTEDEESEEVVQEPKAFRLGIIDMLVRWTMKKKLAHLLKKPTLGFCLKEEIDTEPPNYYQSRFADSMTDKIVAS